jgi:CheY-like chemotaxis protein
MEIVIIDDDLIYRMIVTKMIKIIDASLTINQCENGKAGLAMLERFSNSKQKVVVLLDINMPVLDGWGFLEQVEKSNFYNLDQLIIYIVSSSTDESDILTAKKYGFVKNFFHKPLSREDLEAIISSDYP